MSGAMHFLPTTTVEKLPRMADFAHFSTAAERAIGWPAGTFMDAYSRQLRIATERVVENSEVIQWLLGWKADREWVGTATELLTQVQFDLQPDAMSVGPRPNLPKNAATLGKLLKEAAPVLRERGVQIDFDREGSQGQRLIYLRRVPRL
jgi:hypothetical protein